MSSSLTSMARSPGTEIATNLVLVVADARVSTLLLSHLAASPWCVEYVPDNEAALKLVETRAFDLIITAEATSARQDVALLTQIRAVRPHTRMIILTNESTTTDVIAALRQRAFSYFSGPYTFDNLARMIRMAMEEPCWDDGIEVVSATPAWIRLFVRCDPGTAERVLHFFDALVDMPEKEKGEVAFAFREMLLNAMRHGAKFDPTQYVEISYVRARHMVACRVKDPGTGFNFDELHHAAVSNPPDNPVRHVLFREAAGLAPGGYGILLARHLVDELIHNERGNEVLLIKYLEAKAFDELRS